MNRSEHTEMPQVFLTQPNIPASFTQSRLYRLLEERSQSEERAKRLTAVLDRILEQAEEVLRMGATAPLDFTLHDNKHSFRVAEKIIDVLPPAMQSVLSNEELALLLLSAYLHDIGMTPEREILIKYRDLCVGDKSSNATEEEISDFYQWFDSSPLADSLELPINTSTSLGLDRLEQVLAYFVRAKHNDWSGAWIEKHQELFVVDKYPAFKDDLALLCKSHHYDRAALESDDFRPRQVGFSNKPVIVHLRYLACLLRVADVLDFDPERTPDVIYQHRKIAPQSRIYWYQTFEINTSLNSDRTRFVFEAAPPDAALHQAVRTVAEDINRELALCRRLDESYPFKYSILGDLPYRWDFPSEAIVSITPRHGAYEFIEGAFRPNTAKLLQILSGTNLYSSELDAVRELVQNAFDAIKEAVAYEIIRGTTNAQQLFSTSMEVEVRTEQRDGRLYLVCADNGVGMTKKIIEHYVLVSGNSRSKELRSLERQLQIRGLQLGRTGNFGIGVLSYFMLADHLAIRTRRSQLCGDEDATGWVFETDGIGSFGELRRQSDRVRGTEVRLRIKSGFAGSLQDLETKIYSYLKRILIRAPCNVRFVGPTKNVVWSAGWVKLQEDFTAELAKQMFESRSTAREGELLSAKARERRIKEAEQWQKLEKDFNVQLRWHVFEGALSNGLGYYRAHLPYFALPGGISLAFVPVVMQDGMLILEGDGHRHYGEARGRTLEAWKGMLYSSPQDGFLSFFIEIDWVSGDAGDISVNRWKLRRKTGSEKALAELKTTLRKALREFLSLHEHSTFESLNTRLVNIPSLTKKPYWIAYSKDTVQWAPVEFPATVDNNRRQNISYLGDARLYSVPFMRSYGSNYDWEGIAWPSWRADPHRIALLIGPGVSLVPVFEGVPTVSKLPFEMSEFPPHWNALLGAYFRDLYGSQKGTTVWNRNSPFAQMFSPSNWLAVDSLFAPLRDRSTIFNPLTHRDQLLNDQGFLANFLAQLVTTDQPDLWHAVLESDVALSAAIRSLLKNTGFEEHYFYMNGRWMVFSATSLVTIRSNMWDDEIKKVLTKPSAEWIVARDDQPTMLRLGSREADPWA